MMKTPDCVELKNKIQADILRDLAATPKAEWSRKQAEDLAKSPSPVAEFWRRLKPARNPLGCQVAETGTEYGEKEPAT
jgi:hypothetical protein